MGNLLGQTNTETVFNINQLDAYTKQQIINHIKTMKPKNINLSDEFHKTIQNIELENTKLLPMAIELYTKLLETFGEFNSSQKNDKKLTEKKAFFVRPKFGVDAIIKSAGTLKQVNHILLDETLLDIKDPLFPMNNSDISLEEYNQSFNNVLTKKDMMGINKWVLKNMSIYLKNRFINVFNQNYLNADESKLSCLAKGNYIYKAAKHGKFDDINSFRQILAIPNIVNVFHRILSIRLSEYLLTNNYIDTNIQKGGVTGQHFSIFEQFYKLKNVLKDANKHNKSCAIVFLDISNAFGNMNLKKLYKILELHSVDKNFINYLATFYDNLEYFFDTGNLTTGTFKWTDGLMQGCALSPLLFIFALNYILTHLDKKYKDTRGYNFGNVKMLLTAYVDDVCIICDTMESAEIVYNDFNNLCNMLGLPINKSKSAIMAVDGKYIPDINKAMEQLLPEMEQTISDINDLYQRITDVIEPTITNLNEQSTLGISDISLAINNININEQTDIIETTVKMDVVNEQANIVDEPNQQNFSDIKKVKVFKYLGDYLSNDGTSTESYNRFLKIFTSRLHRLDNKKCDDALKKRIFKESIIPIIQRKTMVMYDITMNDKLKIIAIIKPFMQKWCGTETVNIFYDVNTIITESKDEVIQNLVTENNDFNDDFKSDIEIANYVMKSSTIDFKYSEIDDDFKLDLELEGLRDLTN